MLEKWSLQKPDKEQWKYLWEKWFRKDNLIVMVLVGVLLFVIALPTKQESENEGKGTDTSTEAYGQSEKGKEDNEEGNGKDEFYEEQQERKLRELLSAMDGVGQVEVMITFVSAGEQVVQRDQRISRGNTVEKDSEGGNRTVTQYESDQNTIYRSASGESIPYVIETLNPRVEGVLVVAEGAGDGTVNRSITEAVMALYGVEAHRVKVVPMTNKHISSSGLIQ